MLRLPFNLGIGGAVQTGFRYAWENGYELAVRCDGDGQHIPAELPKVIAPVVAGDADIAIGSRFVANGGYRSSATRRVGIRLLALVVSAIAAPARHGRDVRLPGAEPARAGALRRRLPARLSRGRGNGDDDQAPPAARARCRSRCVSASTDGRRSRALRSIYYMVKVLTRALRRPLPAQHRADRGSMIADSQTPLKVSIAATAASLVLVLVVFELIRSRRLRERYALLWLLTGIVLVVLSAWRGGLNTIAAWLGVRGYPPAVLFAVGLMFVILVLLHYSTVISRLSDQNVVLAQRLALLEAKLRDD